MEIKGEGEGKREGERERGREGGRKRESERERGKERERGRGREGRRERQSDNGLSQVCPSSMCPLPSGSVGMYRGRYSEWPCVYSHANMVLAIAPQDILNRRKLKYTELCSMIFACIML